MEKKLIENAIIAESSLMDYIEKFHAEEKSKLVSRLNNMLCETANEKGISLYELCSFVVPEFSYDIKKAEPHECGIKVKLETTITLKPKQCEEEEDQEQEGRW